MSNNTNGTDQSPQAGVNNSIGQGGAEFYDELLTKTNRAGRMLECRIFLCNNSCLTFEFAEKIADLLHNEKEVAERLNSLVRFSDFSPAEVNNFRLGDVYLKKSEMPEIHPRHWLFWTFQRPSN